jgi:oligopeptidase B
VTLSTAASSAGGDLRPPVAPRRPREIVLHGDRRVDDYDWLRGRERPEVIAYLEAEDAYAEAMMAGTRELQERLYHEMLGRIRQTDLTVPYREGGWYYYTRTEEGKQYPAHCRRPGSLEAPEEVVLDLNRLAEGKRFLSLGVFEISDDGRRLAYAIDDTGFRVYGLRVRDLDTGLDLDDRADDVDSAAWAADGTTLFYTVKDAAKRPCRLYSRRLGEPRAELLYEEPDERFTIAVHRSRSRAWLFLVCSSHTTREVRFRPAGRDGDWQVIEPRRQDHEYAVDHHGGRFYILTNDAARNFRLVSAPVETPGRAHWREELAHRPEVMLEDLDCFARHLVVQEREDGLVRLRIIRLESGESHRIEFPEPVYSAGPDTNREFDTTTFRYRYESFTTPASVYDYDLERRTATLRKRTEVLGGYDPSRYRLRRLHAVAPDGSRIPISLVERTDARANGPAPLLLYGYGAYGHPLSANFNSNRLSLLDRGMVFAIAHVRGGGELGKPWHDQGRMAHKRNSFLDFIACAETLVRDGWTRPDRLAIQGGSAGGLLMGAVTNLRPDLFRVVISQVPFVDVLNTMSDPSLPLTVGEFEEWGNPARPEEYAILRSYCPYSNLSARAYPALLVKTSLHDSQVMYWEPAKYVAKLRTLKTDSNPLLLKVNLAAGHGGASGRYDFLREIAFDYAFLLTRLGLEPAVS